MFKRHAIILTFTSYESCNKNASSQQVKAKGSSTLKPFVQRTQHSMLDLCINSGPLQLSTLSHHRTQGLDNCMYHFSSQVLASFVTNFVAYPGIHFQSSLPYQLHSIVPEATVQACCDTHYALSPLDLCSSPVCVFRIKTCNRCLYLSHFRLIFLIWCSRTLSQCVMWCSNRNCNTSPSYSTASSQPNKDKWCT